MAKKINIRPTSSVYATYKRLSYQPWTAIAEFVDNSTQSFYDHQDELMAVKYNKGLNITINYTTDENGEDCLEIVDNAYGMEWNDFQRAIILDKPPQNTNGRNEFGMGLKTAACWFGSIWSVETTQLNSKNRYYAEINIDELGKYKTEEIDVLEETVSLKEHYTKIQIRKLNKKLNGPRTIGKVKDLLSSIYRQDIRSGFVKIYYNDTLLQFKEAPIFNELENGVNKEWKKDIAFSIMHEGKELYVRGFVALRMPGSVKDAGFTLLRRGRVIVGGSEKNYRPSELFGDSNSYTWQRMYGELHMDNWPVTQAKDDFDWHNSGLEESFIEALEPFTKDYRRKAETIRVRERANISELVQDAITGLSNSGIVENIGIEVVNRADSQNHVEVQEEKEIISSEHSEEENLQEEVVANNNNGVIIDGGDQVNYTFKYKGIEYVFHIVFDTSDPTLHWLMVESISNNEYILSINMKHSFFKPLIEKKEFLPLMTKMSIALVLAEIESMMLSSDGKINPCDIRIKMNEILENVRKGGNDNE
ncbi:MAG: ATP-binding protein [Alphaproteobacteria bacterium]|nr:ATP-binding protein [Alphaproteobacteria bacterium]